MDLIRYLFSVEGFSDLTSPEGIRVAVTPDNTMYGACRLEQGSDGSWNVRPIVVFDVVQGKGVGRALLKDALRLHPDLRLVARGEIEPFYLSCGFERCGWDAIAPEYRAECDACPDKAACAPLPFRSLPIERTFTFLGTSSGCGVPAFFCHCPACEAARKDPTKRRGCTALPCAVMGRPLSTRHLTSAISSIARASMSSTISSSPTPTTTTWAVWASSSTSSACTSWARCRFTEASTP